MSLGVRADFFLYLLNRLNNRLSVKWSLEQESGLFFKLPRMEQTSLVFRKKPACEVLPHGEQDTLHFPVLVEGAVLAPR